MIDLHMDLGCIEESKFHGETAESPKAETLGKFSGLQRAASFSGRGAIRGFLLFIIFYYFLN